MTIVTKRKFGISITLIFVLALLGVPRVVAHDLKWVETGSLVNLLLVFIPPVIWIIVVLWKKTSKPFISLLMIGMIYGLLLAITHQILWNASFDEPITLGGNLADLSPGLTVALARTFAFFSSLVTGILVGAVTGLVGLVIHRITVKS